MKDIIRDVESIYNDFDNNLITVPKDFTIASKSGRFVGGGSKHNGIYRLTYPITGNEVIDNTLRTHEYGHIYLGHFEGIHEELDRSLMRIIHNRDSQLVKMVNKSCNIDYADQILDRVISEPMLNHFIHNISMDMEVNSVVLDKDDISNLTSEVNKLLYDEYMKLSDNGTKMPSQKAMDNLYTKFDIKLIQPSDLGFPDGLTYPDYLVQCILHLDVVLKYMSDKMNNYGTSQKRRSQCENQDQSQESQGGQGMPSNQDGNCQGDGNGSGSSMPQTMEEFEEMMRNAQSDGGEGNHDSDESTQSQGGDQGENESNGGSSGNDQSDDDDDQSNGNGNSDDQNEECDDGQGSGDGSEEDDSDMDHSTDSRIEADDRRKNDLGNYNQSGGNGRGLQGSDNIRNYQVNNDPLTIALEEVIREYRHKVIKRDFTKDMTYKYNRRVLGRGNKMLSPTYRQKITKTEEPTILFAVDVSGSMDTGLVDRIITTIRNQMKRINRGLKYNIAAWDTSLQQYYKDITFNTPVPKLSCGGGTRMAGVFDLFKQDFGRDSILILISDFGDDMNEWHSKESSMDGYSMYGFKYGNDSYWGYHGAMPNWKNFKVRQCD